jgi:ribosome-binding factor A
MNPESDRDWSEEVGPEDGSDPRRFHDRRQRRSAPRKSLQLAAQVAEALRSILAGAADDRLREVEVLHVEPAPNSGRLRVLVRTDHPEVLPAATPYLRSEIATAIVRRLTPELIFEVVT